MKFNSDYTNLLEFIENTIYINYYYLILVFFYIISDDILKALDYFIFRLILNMIMIFNKKINNTTRNLMSITRNLLSIRDKIEMTSELDEQLELDQEILLELKKLSNLNIIEFRNITLIKKGYLSLKDPIYTYINTSNDRRKSLLVVRKINNLFKNMDDACYFVEQNSNIISGIC